MLEQSKFLVSFDCQNEKFCEELIITYRTEELRPYLIFPRENLNPRTNINRIQNRNIRLMKKKSKNQVYIPHQDKWNEHFPTPGKPNPNYYTDSGATFNKHLRTQNKLKQKRK